MEGQTLSHYKILGKLGGGAMGVVYKALDVRLRRHVALKLLPPELTRDENARERFVLEARAASALDHPNICTIYDIEETPDGQLFIVMGHYDGETLKKRIERGPLAVEEALDIAIQVAQGLQKAHESGIVHRDIKPANLMITEGGLVKILDFGIAKLLGVTGLTQTGSSPGTVLYMSPEQIAGEEADQQSDVWALGAVLYEMLTGQLPFKGDSQWAVINGISNRTPAPISAMRGDVPAEAEEIVFRALEKPREQRFPSTTVLLEALRGYQKALSQAGGPVTTEIGVIQALRRPKAAVPVMLVSLALVSLAVFTLSRGADAQWAREEAVPEIARLIESDDLEEAFELAAEARRFIPNDPILTELELFFSSTYSISTTPPGADVYVRDYAAINSDWEYLGESPVAEVDLPRGTYRWRLEHEQFEVIEFATPVRSVDIDVSLSDAAANPSEWAFVPAGGGPVPLTSFLLESVDLDDFNIGKHEVTNEQFKEFLDSGGYQTADYWVDQKFFKDGRQLPWEDAVAEFVDTTGRPGPATWELGDYPGGEDTFPVSGVSWHEAVAYARFRGQELPTVYHWSRAALPAGEITNPLGPAIVPLSNFDGGGAAAVGQYQGMGPHGTYDMAGNVREWVWNAVGNERLILGGAWSDPGYLFSIPVVLSSLDRSPLNGFRTVQYSGDAELPDQLRQPVPLERNVSPAAEPVTQEVFEAYERQFSYASSPLNASSELTALESDDWVRERIILDAAYGDEKVIAYLFLPKTATPPYQAVVHFPGVGSFNSLRSSENLGIGEGTLTSQWVMGAIVKSGRAVLWPVYKGSFERFTARREAFAGEERLMFHREQRVQWYQDLSRILDYLEGRDDVDSERVGFLGASYGASAALPLLALEDRLKAAVLLSGGVPYEPLPPEVDPVHYLSRTTIPVLMLNGLHDYVFPRESNQDPLFELLATPPDQKRRVLYEAGHSPLPRGPAIRETVDWFDRYLGPSMN